MNQVLHCNAKQSNGFEMHSIGLGLVLVQYKLNNELLTNLKKKNHQYIYYIHLVSTESNEQK